MNMYTGICTINESVFAEILEKGHDWARENKRNPNDYNDSQGNGASNRPSGEVPPWLGFYATQENEVSC